MAKANTVLSIVANAPKPTPDVRGRLLYVEDIQALLGSPRGKPATRWWINHSFFTEGRLKVGRFNAWWELDVLEYLNSTKGKAS